MNKRIFAVFFVVLGVLFFSSLKNGHSDSPGSQNKLETIKSEQAADGRVEARLKAVDCGRRCGSVQSEINPDGSVVLTFNDLWAQTDAGIDYDRTKCTVYLTYSMPAGHQVDKVRFTVEGTASTVNGGNISVVTRLRSAGTSAVGVYTEIDQSGAFSIDSNEFEETVHCSAGEDITLKASVILEAERPFGSGEQASVEVFKLTMPALPLKACTQ